MKGVFYFAIDPTLLLRLNLSTSRILRTSMACAQTLKMDGFEHLWPGKALWQTTENLKAPGFLGGQKHSKKSDENDFVSPLSVSSPPPRDKQLQCPQLLAS